MIYAARTGRTQEPTTFPLMSRAKPFYRPRIAVRRRGHIEIGSEFIHRCDSFTRQRLSARSSLSLSLSSLSRCRKSRSQRTVGEPQSISPRAIDALFIYLSFPLSYSPSRSFHPFLNPSLYYDRSLIERNGMKFAIFSDSSSAIRPSSV